MYSSAKNKTARSVPRLISIICRSMTSSCASHVEVPDMTLGFDVETDQLPITGWREQEVLELDNVA